MDRLLVVETDINFTYGLLTNLDSPIFALAIWWRSSFLIHNSRFRKVNMIFAVGSVLAALVASLTAVSKNDAKNKKTAAIPVQSVKQSPKKKDLGAVRIKQEDMNANHKKKKLGYHFKILKLKPDFEIVWIDATPGNDGYAQDLFNHITDQDGFREFGLLMVARRRMSQANNDELRNTRNNYPRRCIVRALDDNSTHESRLNILRAFQQFLSRPEFNKYDYTYTVDNESDLTPDDDANLVAMDHFIQDDVIVNLMKTVYEETDSDWYGRNNDCALDFFSGPLFPDYAVEALGYPSNRHNVPGFAR